MRFGKNYQTGSSLIEIAVTIIIVATGLLGLAGLQANSARFLKTANQRSEATQAAYDISERMRANGAGVKANNYTYTTSYASTIASIPTIPSCSGSTCLASEIAAIDINSWLANLAYKLNGGAGYIAANGVGSYDITVMWQEAGYADVDLACPIGAGAPGAGVRCFVVRTNP